MFSHDFISTAQPEVFFSKSAKLSVQYFSSITNRISGMEENFYKFLFNYFWIDNRVFD